MEWQPIETAPKTGVRLLAAFPRGGEWRVDIVTWFDDHWRSIAMAFVNGDRRMRREQPTHWMPLPQPPGGSNA